MTDYPVEPTAEIKVVWLATKMIGDAFPWMEWSSDMKIVTVRKPGSDVPIAQFDVGGLADAILALFGEGE